MFGSLLKTLMKLAPKGKAAVDDVVKAVDSRSHSLMGNNPNMRGYYTNLLDESDLPVRSGMRYVPRQNMASPYDLMEGVSSLPTAKGPFLPDAPLPQSSVTGGWYSPLPVNMSLRTGQRPDLLNSVQAPWFHNGRDIHYGQHIESTPFHPESVQKAYISYLLDKKLTDGMKMLDDIKKHGF